jgi:hypothetical protein
MAEINFIKKEVHPHCNLCIFPNEPVIEIQDVNKESFRMLICENCLDRLYKQGKLMFDKYKQPVVECEKNE